MSTTLSAEEPMAAPALRGARILLVEDQAPLRSLLTEVLQAAGHLVHAFDNGRAALRHLEQEAVDVIVTDLCMPECDGFQLLRLLREQGGPRTDVIVISGGIGEEVAIYIRMAVQLGACAALEKPFPLEKLVALVESSLGKRR
jgi:DNA-binding NtrC family response regulator